jgi:gas vesicle protein
MFGRNKKKKGKSTVDKIVMGAIIGTAVGSVLGLAVAPKKGEETREMIKEQYKNRRELLEKGKEKIHEHEEDMKEIGQLAKETIVGVLTLAKNFIHGKKKGSPSSQKMVEDSSKEILREQKNLRQIPHELASEELLEEKAE